MARLIYIFVIFLSLSASAQNIPANGKAFSADTGEAIFVHTNATLLLTGETLYCKFYCLDTKSHTPSGISKMIYVSLIGSDSKIVLNQKIFLENGIARGDFFIPATLATGNYKLIAYTKWMLDYKADDFFETDITIVNPYQPYQENKTINENTEPETKTSNAGNVTLQTNKSVYATREKVDLKISGAVKGHYSISVRKTDNLSLGKQTHATAFPVAETKNYYGLPELRGEMVTGHIVSKKDAKSLKDKAIALSMPGTSYALKITHTDALGRFIFNLDESPYNPEMVIQIMEQNREDYSLILDENKQLDLSNLKFPTGVNLTPDMKNAIQERSVAAQVENAYYELKKDTVRLPKQPEPFFYPLGKEYVLDDYTRFPTLKETVIEVLKEIYFTRDNDKYSLHVRNTTMDNEIYGPPLVLVDGLLIQDADELFQYPAKNILKVNLLNEPYVYGPKIFGGLISFTTRDKDFKTGLHGDFIKTISFQQPAAEKEYFHPDYSKKPEKRIPDYRMQLLWNPEVNLENPQVFYTSDSIGTFEIILEGFTENGIPVSITTTFEVR